MITYLSTRAAEKAVDYYWIIYIALLVFWLIVVPIVTFFIVRAILKKKNAERARKYEAELRDVVIQLKKIKEGEMEVPEKRRQWLVRREHQLILSLQTKYYGLTEQDYKNFDYPYDS